MLKPDKFPKLLYFTFNYGTRAFFFLWAFIPASDLHCAPEATVGQILNFLKAGLCRLTIDATAELRMDTFDLVGQAVKWS